MNRRNGSVAMLLLKWLVIPVALIAVGYFLVGPFVPQILGTRAPIKTIEPAPEPITAQTTDEPTYGEPQVDVSAHPAGTGYASSRSTGYDSHRRRRRRKKKPKAEAPVNAAPVDAPPVDAPPVTEPPPTTTTTTTGGG